MTWDFFLFQRIDIKLHATASLFRVPIHMYYLPGHSLAGLGNPASSASLPQLYQPNAH